MSCSQFPPFHPHVLNFAIIMPIIWEDFVSPCGPKMLLCVFMGIHSSSSSYWLRNATEVRVINRKKYPFNLLTVTSIAIGRQLATCRIREECIGTYYTFLFSNAFMVHFFFLVFFLCATSSYNSVAQACRFGYFFYHFKCNVSE